MERTKYIELCRMVSLLPESSGTKQNVPGALIVSCSGIPYYPIGYYLTYDNGTPIHIAVLHDLVANSTTKCRLNDVNKEDAIE